MNLPAEMLAAVRAATERHADDVSAAAAEAEAVIRDMPGYGDLVTALVRHAVRDLVYAQRHALNTTIRAQQGRYGGPARVRLDSSSVAKVYSVYLYCIGGRTLGDMTGEELARVAQDETARADGHLFNARLCRALTATVGAGRRVRHVLSEKRLAALFRQLQEEQQTPVRDDAPGVQDGAA